MRMLFQAIFSFLLVVIISSCTPSEPYEIKSPCVAINSNDYSAPCVRRPINLDRAIT